MNQPFYSRSHLTCQDSRFWSHTWRLWYLLLAIWLQPLKTSWIKNTFWGDRYRVRLCRRTETLRRSSGKVRGPVHFFHKKYSTRLMTFCKIVFTNNQQDVKYFNSPCVWFLILISFDDTWFFELHFRSPVTFHSCTPGKERYLRPMIFSYQSLWCWWQHMNSQ